ncbi:MAG: hypothetical protein U5N26_10195 [Candidatus Marinimicrobia bacterium]|nr:hypothetical protein [Candidatus Neomarinimicrobiota bacterium]
MERPFVLLLKIAAYPAETTLTPPEKFSGKAGDPRKILLHPGAAQKGRLWPAEHWKRLIALLQKEKYDFAWITPPGETAPAGRQRNKGGPDRASPCI